MGRGAVAPRSSRSCEFFVRGAGGPSSGLEPNKGMDSVDPRDISEPLGFVQTVLTRFVVGEQHLLPNMGISTDDVAEQCPPESLALPIGVHNQVLDIEDRDVITHATDETDESVLPSDHSHMGGPLDGLLESRRVTRIERPSHGVVEANEFIDVDRSHGLDLGAGHQMGKAGGGSGGGGGSVGSASAGSTGAA